MLTGCGMVVDMKTMAIEFTLTAEATGQGGSDSIRLRVLLPGDSGSVISCWRKENVLGEQIWLGGTGEDAFPTLGAAILTRQGIVWWAMRLMAERMNGHPDLVVRELPNGAIVFDLGTV